MVFRYQFQGPIFVMRLTDDNDKYWSSAHLLKDVDSALGSLHLVNAGSATDVSEVHSASILRV
jgi:hypothetical protein